MQGCGPWALHELGRRWGGRGSAGASYGANVGPGASHMRVGCVVAAVVAVRLPIGDTGLLV